MLKSDEARTLGSSLDSATSPYSRSVGLRTTTEASRFAAVDSVIEWLSGAGDAASSDSRLRGTSAPPSGATAVLFASAASRSLRLRPNERARLGMCADAAASFFLAVPGVAPRLRDEAPTLRPRRAEGVPARGVLGDAALGLLLDDFARFGFFADFSASSAAGTAAVSPSAAAAGAASGDAAAPSSAALAAASASGFSAGVASSAAGCPSGDSPACCCGCS
mmetsp:Transcript_4788/g.15159  ORF Transcript_4788/g.15159 Transcript_4788/m.15159 type:complete len:221 (-) Transcript_4788:101-763(-)